MTLQLELWHAISLVIVIIGGYYTVGKIAAGQKERREDERHAALHAQMTKIEADIREEAKQWSRVERELLALKADLPLNYVRRDDFVRIQSVIESKIDSLALRIENAYLKREQK